MVGQALFDDHPGGGIGGGGGQRIAAITRRGKRRSRPRLGAGQIGPGEVLRARSLIGGQFEGRIVGAAKVGDLDAILPEISGRAWITGTHQHMLDPADPWPEGYRLSDTWGAR